jgi:hypothetical protein
MGLAAVDHDPSSIGTSGRGARGASVGRGEVMPPAGKREPTLQGQVEAVSVKAHEAHRVLTMTGVAPSM